MVCIRVDATEAAAGKMVIEFITNYGNLFPFFRGKENGDSDTMKRFTAKLQEFCKENDLTLSVTGMK